MRELLQLLDWSWGSCAARASPEQSLLMHLYALRQADQRCWNCSMAVSRLQLQLTLFLESHAHTVQ